MTTDIAMGFNQRKPPDRMITVWATDVKILDLVDSITSYLEEITAYLKNTSLLISSTKSSVTLFSSDTHQANTHSRILIEGLTVTAGPMPKNIRRLHRHHSIIQQAYRLRSRESIQQKQYTQGLVRYILGTTERNISDDM